MHAYIWLIFFFQDSSQWSIFACEYHASFDCFKNFTLCRARLETLCPYEWGLFLSLSLANWLIHDGFFMFGINCSPFWRNVYICLYPVKETFAIILGLFFEISICWTFVCHSLFRIFIDIHYFFGYHVQSSINSKVLLIHKWIIIQR